MYDKMPKGMTEFETYAAEIIANSGLPDNDSVRFSLATAIMHTPAPSIKDYLSVAAYLSATLQKAAANQVAAQVVQDLKQKQQAEFERLKAEQDAQKDQVSDSH